MPIGQNDAITWPELAGLFRRKDVSSVEKYLAYLAEHGVTCLRLMLEYAQSENRYLERPVGKYQPNVVRLWDDLFSLCAKYGLRILLTPFDTFWMWLRWNHHPYNRRNGGPCGKRSQWVLCPDTLAAIKARLSFATERWGGSGVLFAWDIWNELHPAHAENSTEPFAEFVAELSDHLRSREIELYGRAHPQTVSVFGPALDENPAMVDVIMRHPQLNFASTHFYDSATINHPRNTVDPAICTGRLVAEALSHITDQRPFFESEHGPIHAFKDLHRTLPEPFDNEYFRHIQWAHLASGGAGGGMRWPNRHPHCLTPGMRKEQQSLVEFCRLIRWDSFHRTCLNRKIGLSSSSLAGFGCGDGRQAILYLLRTDRLNASGMIDQEAPPVEGTVFLPEMEPGTYQIIFWDPKRGGVKSVAQTELQAASMFSFPHLPIQSDLALAIQKN
ncbi:hypothetical protein BH24BAC1_BH24BAC1_17240 [soil metagenome]